VISSNLSELSWPKKVMLAKISLVEMWAMALKL